MSVEQCGNCLNWRRYFCKVKGWCGFHRMDKVKEQHCDEWTYSPLYEEEDK